MDRNPSFPALARRTTEQLQAWGPFRTPTSRKSSEQSTEEQIGPLGLSTVHSPPGEASANLIFVHGLGGGSRKSWTKDSNPSLFWPQEWLPRDVEFRDVRIHTFGYDSNWDKGSILDVTDFATSLLEWVTNDPQIARDGEKPLVLVCHSMGGLVAKQAFILSRQTQQYQRVGLSLRSIFFLATPHRGSDLAETLSKILSLSPGSRPFVGDLKPSSKAIQSINEAFPRFSDGLVLHSFYETLPMQLGYKKDLVVRKESAVLGYHNERATYLDADHRHVCKYDSPTSTNYRAVRNALADTLKSLTAGLGLRQRTSFPEQQQVINAALGIHDSPEDDYIRVEDTKLEGSCEWIAHRPEFESWRTEGRPHIYWVTAKPGAGKSVLCSHVLKTLRGQGLRPAFFFLVHSDKSKSSLSALLRSTAWQLASIDASVFEHLTKVCSRDPQLHLAEHHILWRKLYVECVFKHRPDTPHYWMIDALDECKHDGDLAKYLASAAATGNFRIFVTSRTAFDSYGVTRTPQSEIHLDAISAETTNADIELYIHEHQKYLLTREPAYTAKLLLEKSDGCFLWTKLALHELRQGLTRSGIQSILDEVPTDMNKLYNRIISTMFARARERRMIVAVMEWTTCAIRPLTTEELYHALRIDMDDEIDGDVRRFIENNCGQLVVVDDRSGHVRMVHLTAREFLFSEQNTTHRLDRAEAHKRLLLACLKYVAGPEMLEARPRRLSGRQIYTEQGAFAMYAAVSLFEHLAFVHSDDDEVAASMIRFLRSTHVLVWIEHLARHADLSRLVQAGLGLRKYITRRLQKTLPFGNSSKDNAFLEKWATDLIRLVTKFGSQLKASPSSIVNLVAPFCPPESAIRTQFASSNRAIKVSGLTATSWDDCASTIAISETVNAVACAPGIFAIGLQRGSVIIYDEQACQTLRTLEHGEPVKRIIFGTNSGIIIAAGLHNITAWSSDTWRRQWRTQLSSQFMSLCLFDNDNFLLSTLRSNQIQIWSAATGEVHEPLTWLDDDIDDQTNMFRRPAATALATDQPLLAVVYRGEDVLVWNVEHGSKHDVLGKYDGSLGPGAEPRSGVSMAINMLFNRATSGSQLLAVGYNDGAINVFDVDQGVLRATTSANAHTLASSNDGLTLACGDSGGMVQLFEFDTLKLLYRIQAGQSHIKQLAFSADDQRLLGVQSRYCYVWDPPVLIRHAAEEENSDTVSVSTAPAQDVKMKDPFSTISITCLATIESGKIAFCGHDDGSVRVYQIGTANAEPELLRHARNTEITMLAWDAVRSILVSVDVSSRVLVHALDQVAGKGYVPRAPILDVRIGTSVTQVLLNRGAKLLLVSTEQGDQLFSLQQNYEQTDGTTIVSKTMPGRRRHRWCTHTRQPGHLVLIMDERAHIYEWESLTPLTKAAGIRLPGLRNSALHLTNAQPCFDGSYLALTYAEGLNPFSPSQTLFYQSSSLVVSDDVCDYESSFSALSERVQVIIEGPTSQRVVFLDRDGWMCSASNAACFDIEHYDRHHFLPPDWLSSVNRLQMSVVGRDATLLFVRRDELITVRRGLQFFEHGQSRALGKRPSISRTTMSQESMMSDHQDSIAEEEEEHELPVRARRSVPWARPGRAASSPAQAVHTIAGATMDTVLEKLR